MSGRPALPSYGDLARKLKELRLKNVALSKETAVFKERAMDLSKQNTHFKDRAAQCHALLMTAAQKLKARDEL